MGSHDWSRWALGATAVLLIAGCTAAEEAEVADTVPEDIAEVGILRVATDPTFPPAQFELPLEFQGVEREPITGFEVDLVLAVAEELGLDVEWREVPFGEVLELVDSGEADVGSSSITVTQERAEERLFVTFFTSATQWAARVPNATGVGPNNACGARVAVQADTVFVEDLLARSAACQEAGDDPIEILAFVEQGDVVQAVLNGRANAFLSDSIAVQWAIRQASGGATSGGAIRPGTLIRVGEAYDEAPFGWAVPGDDEQLAQALQEALRAVIDSGDYREILDARGVAGGAITAEEVEIVGG